MYRKGTILIRKLICSPPDGKKKQLILPFYQDVFNNAFWNEHSEILGLKSPPVYNGTIPEQHKSSSQTSLGSGQSQGSILSQDLSKSGDGS